MKEIGNGDELPSIINDPFNSKMITDITIKFTHNLSGVSYWYGKIEFKNGNTKGEQRTPNCKDYASVMKELNKIMAQTKQSN